MAASVLPDCCIFLSGELGVGKTTLTRAFVKRFLPDALVKSPTYTLVESYEARLTTLNEDLPIKIHHFDLYRLNDPEELEYYGIRDSVSENVILLIEWPEKGKGYLPPVDLCVQISRTSDNPDGRTIQFSAFSDSGKQMLLQLKEVTSV